MTARKARAARALPAPPPTSEEQGSRPVDREAERKEILTRFMAQRGLKSTAQRDLIIHVFFDARDHIAIGDLHRQVLKQNPRIGYATVYRTLKMLTECGLAAERNFGDGQTRYEPNEVDHHHDHLICRACGMIVEFENDEIERLQKVVAASYGFVVDSHRHELYGLCPKCQKARSRKEVFRGVG